MKTFITEDFLLKNEYSQRLYHEYAKNAPVIDFHCHLPAEEIAADRQFENLTQIWLHGDHYKWRALRAMGIAEKYITGSGSDYEKYMAWARIVPFTIRNPLYHWTHLELLRYFDVKDLLTEDTANAIWSRCNEQLATQDFSVRNLIRKMNVEVICTTDDPADSLKHHYTIRESGFEVKVLPTFRPDPAFALEHPDYLKYLQRLEAAARMSISDLDGLIHALERRIEDFHAIGCRLSDHGFEQMYSAEIDEKKAKEGFLQVLSGKTISPQQLQSIKSYIVWRLCIKYHEKQWTQQFHLGPIRQVNTRLTRLVGADSGVDSIGDFQQATSMASFLDLLDREDQLAKTILYNVNPAYNEVFATMAGNFNDGSVAGKMQYGAAWWFLDQKNGMEKHLDTLSSLGLVSQFVGMVTDSRSFLSYTRHEYFRRILCEAIGNDVLQQELPADIPFLGKIISDISYHNAKNYFGFNDE